MHSRLIIVKTIVVPDVFYGWGSGTEIWYAVTVFTE